jgi:glycosyltransferase involved in cell wall biosynthesis
MHGIYEAREPNSNFRTGDYLALNRDVAESRLCPVRHYINNGWRENRKTCVNQKKDIIKEEGVVTSKNKDAENLRNNIFDIVYISGFPNSPSHSYRVNDSIEALKECGVSSTWIRYENINKYSYELHFSKCICLFRLPHTENLEKLISSWKEAGVVVCYDCDDYIFDKNVANEKNVDGLRYLNDLQLKQYNKDVLNYRKALLLCDIATFSTQPLVEACQEIGVKTVLIHNTINNAKYKNSMEVLNSRAKNKEGKKITIGYASGSYTHQKDLRVAASSIVHVLKKYEYVEFCVLGDIKLNEINEFQNADLSVRKRIHNRIKVSEKELLNELSKFDINIAPLEYGNPYCEAKSELKYFDAGLLEIPTVASPTQPYRSAITNGKDGYIAASEDDWINSLEMLIRDEEMRCALGKYARAKVQQNYSITTKCNELNKFLVDVNEISKGRSRTCRKTVTVLLPGLIKGSGGHAIHFDMVNQYVKSGMFVRILFLEPTTDFETAEDIQSYYGFDKEKVRCSYNISFDGITNIFIATHWSTVNYVEKNHSKSSKYYIILDYEPYFYPMSEDFIRAQFTYKTNIHKVTWGPWIKNILEKHDDIVGVKTFPFYYNKNVYSQSHQIKKTYNKVLFFARPLMPRRCFNLGIEAIFKYQSKYGYNTEFVLFGSDNLEKYNLPIQYTDLGVLSPKQLNSLYNEAGLAIVFSTTNPSKAPFEMMACGLPVLDLNINSSVISYGSFDNAFLCDPDADQIAETINNIMTDRSLVTRKSTSALKYSMDIDDEYTAAEKLIKIIKS